MHSIKHEWASVVVARFWKAKEKKATTEKEKNNFYSNFIIELLFAFRISCDVDFTSKMALSFPRFPGEELSRRGREEEKFVGKISK